MADLDDEVREREHEHLEGEVLVALTAAPAWTPLFARAVAVITDGGSLAAHASLVAREYGIPAVVVTGDATMRLTDGQRVTVDGSAGWLRSILDYMGIRGATGRPAFWAARQAAGPAQPRSCDNAASHNTLLDTRLPRASAITTPARRHGIAVLYGAALAGGNRARTSPSWLR